MRTLVILAMALVMWSGAAVAQPTVVIETTGELKAVLDLKGDPERGKAAFRDCGGCHRKDASGRVKQAIPRLSGQHASVILKQIVDIRSGHRINTPMKPILSAPYLNLQSFADIASYIEALPISDDQGKGPGTKIERGKALFARDCAGCHGNEGEGRPEAFYPMLAAQHYTYLMRELGLIRDGGRGNSNPVMRSLIGSYSQADLQAVADYISQLPPPKQ